MTEDPETAALNLDPIQTAMRDIFARLARYEERVIRRMLCQWDAAWGEPHLFVSPTGSQHHRFSESSVYQTTLSVKSNVLGLGQAQKEGHTLHIRIYAGDQVNAAGEVRPPVPDLGMLAIFEARMTPEQKEISRHG